MTNPLGTNLGGSAPFCERGDTAKGKLMYLARGGALTALTLIIATGCGGSDAGPVLGASGNGDAGPVVVEGPEIPDGGAPEVPLPPAPPPPADGKPVEGVFVSSSKGIDDADATMLRPVKTLARAMAIAVEKKTLPVIACAETYNEAVKLTDGVTMYGYFDCSGAEWKKVTTRAKIVSPSSPAVLADGLKLPVRFEGFELVAPNMTGTPAAGVPAASSYGMVVKATNGLSLGDLLIRAGSAQDGVDGAEPAEGNANLQDSSGYPAEGKLKKVCTRFGCNFDDSVVVGSPPATTPGAWGGTSSCKVGPNGGDGGEGGGARISGNDGEFRLPWDSTDIRGRPLVADDTTAAGGAYGKAGGAGSPGPAGAFGVNGVWSFADAGFVPADGSQGANGHPGKGGGGGAGKTEYGPTSPPPKGDGIWRTGIGGGGGAGGCGGIAGAGGKGGGASVGVFVVGSVDVTITNSRVEAGQAGRAGKGAAGTSGTAGGAGGAVPGAGVPGSAGGKGGDGGPAGQSGHGSVGPSIALAFKGARPKTTNVELVAGQAGPGAAAVVRDGQSLPAVTGEAKAEHSF